MPLFSVSVGVPVLAPVSVVFVSHVHLPSKGTQATLSSASIPCDPESGKAWGCSRILLIGLTGHKYVFTKIVPKVLLVTKQT